MANHKRRRPKNTRSGCLMCKPHKANGFKHQVKIKGVKGKVDIRSARSHRDHQATSAED